MRRFSIMLALAGVVALAFALFTTPTRATDPDSVYWRAVQSNQKFVGNVRLMKSFVPTATEVALTSPTTSFSAVDKYEVLLNLDANLTGIKPTSGMKGQHLLIRMGAGSNTARIDSGASMTLNGSNLTFTESQNDNVELECTNAEGDEWRLLWHNGGS